MKERKGEGNLGDERLALLTVGRYVVAQRIQRCIPHWSLVEHYPSQILELPHH
jgi:hypothetical protein